MGCLVGKFSSKSGWQSPENINSGIKLKKINVSKSSQYKISSSAPPLPLRDPSLVPPSRPAPLIPSRKPQLVPPIPPRKPQLVPPILPRKPQLTSTHPRNDQYHVQLYISIYVAIDSYHRTKENDISFEKGDEMQWIQEVNPSELEVIHLRSGKRGIVPNNLVRLDKETPLRLAENNRGKIQQYLMHYNVQGAYLIRYSTSEPNGFVLSILQPNKDYNTLHWHYVIHIKPSNNRFYFPKEKSLEELDFSSFHELIANETVRSVISLTEILPLSIDFEQEIGKLRFDELEISEEIGSGKFGIVSRGIWKRARNTIPVAIKKCSAARYTSMLKREVEVMKNLTSPYILTLYGTCENPVTKEILIVTELMSKGDLKSWLKKLPTLPEPSTLVGFAKYITLGMAYLEASNYVHRDLACRNILLGPHENIVKIADLGLSKIIHSTSQDQHQAACEEYLPLVGSAPELLISDFSAYSIKSDVWSFGILLIEIWLKGGEPYENKHPEWIKSAVRDGYVHERPSACPVDFYDDVIRRCLSFRANDRPTFKFLNQHLSLKNIRL
ncbi:unnamed protein product [Rotaria magnacalcarata]|uniref:non-specific protein-tyrosine kinase n=1 Tax=Rotaria magnacalcarata TaxID=392030 RepID=A0A816LKW1_9BILA|nr:unnamed protein product [Rotaria magnacalcarata]CAF1942744.1 unnamed protein product [Rotaria magnacalcarata]CAF3811891.1 unnamed protein product [Rotaria magnacalcarata]CAF3907929.1 unnamed protein product [Rotaria magnacalcarata]